MGSLLGQGLVDGLPQRGEDGGGVAELGIDPAARAVEQGVVGIAREADALRLLRLSVRQAIVLSGDVLQGFEPVGHRTAESFQISAKDFQVSSRLLGLSTETLRLSGDMPVHISVLFPLDKMDGESA